MKAKRLILEKYSSTESRRAVLRQCLVQEAGPAERAAKQKEKSVRKKPCIIEERSTPVEPPRASKKDKRKEVLIEKVPLRRTEDPVKSIRLKVPREHAAEVLTMFSDIEEDPMALEEVAAKAVEDVTAAESVRNRTQTKVAVAAEVATKERRSQPTEAKCQALQKRLTAEVEKRRKAEQVGEDLREDVERAKCASVDLLKRLEACRIAYDAESLKLDELSAAAKKKEHE
ncbi:hypothetical protein AXG93_3617s1020 [Marchantia polymorpha subsp. ruderalis]|uniref:Uncharacterized protein n=1 Tax=Marchantia polymorpha subsp. ruderalis TaxID=1480154 RepID=A0A176WEV6_MARPO|nr:hypothetical protein AXG93_3617s1020 [Marchantia polymorpha subsp. ruderalis]